MMVKTWRKIKGKEICAWVAFTNSIEMKSAKHTAKGLLGNCPF
jgi:hypothetical protein